MQIRIWLAYKAISHGIKHHRKQLEYDTNIFDLKAVWVLSMKLCCADFTTKYNTNATANYLITVNFLSINYNLKHETWTKNTHHRT